MNIVIAIGSVENIYKVQPVPDICQSQGINAIIPLSAQFLLQFLTNPFHIFLLDPGIPGVRSMGPGLCHSLTMLT